MIPLRTALNKVRTSSRLTLFWSPADLMLTRIPSAMNGDRIASIATDARFFVVLAFIRFVCSTVDAMRYSFATSITFTTGVPVAQLRFYGSRGGDL